MRGGAAASGGVGGRVYYKGLPRRAPRRARERVPVGKGIAVRWMVTFFDHIFGVIRVIDRERRR